MTRRARKGVVESVSIVGTADGARARSADGAAGVASAGRTDAVNSGIVRARGRSGGGGSPEPEPSGPSRRGRQRPGGKAVRARGGASQPVGPSGPGRDAGPAPDGSPRGAAGGAAGDALPRRPPAFGASAPAAGDPARARKASTGGALPGNPAARGGAASAARAAGTARSVAGFASGAGDAAYGDDDGPGGDAGGRAVPAAMGARARRGATARADGDGPPGGVRAPSGTRPPAVRPAGYSEPPPGFRSIAAGRGGGAMRGAAERLRARRAWRSARAAAAPEQAARRAAGGKLATAASSIAAPAAGALAGTLCLVLAVLAVAQAASALLGFWENADMEEALAGLPPYVTREMVDAALGCQEAYGHPAGCTLAQVIVESGDGDGLSGLAERDRNLFGIKWSPSFSSCPEVAGKSKWPTAEEAGGEVVEAEADFASFGSFADCVAFRSRVVLAEPRYAGNALVKEAVEGRDSDKMAEGLEDAGWATASGYADALKAAMDAYGLRRFDSMPAPAPGPGASASGAGAEVVAAARSQLGVPYVWGGTQAGVGLDCSGLTQWCYAQAGVAIPRNSEDQAAAGRKVALSRAEPGDVLWRPGHVAIYIGGDRYIHEPRSGDVCRVASGISYFTWAIRF